VEVGVRTGRSEVLGEALARGGGRMTVTVELTGTRSARIVWAEILDQKLDDASSVLDAIGG